MVEKLGSVMVDDGAEIVDDIVNPHYQVALRDTAVEGSTSQEAAELAGRQLG